MNVILNSKYMNEESTYNYLRSYIEENELYEYTVYIDGACNGMNSGSSLRYRGGFGWVICDHTEGMKEVLINEQPFKSPEVTNNRMEMMALIDVLTLFNSISQDHRKTFNIRIKSDSKLLVD